MFNPAKKYEIHRNCGLVSTSSSTESFRDRGNFQLGGKIIFSRKLVNHRLNVEYFGRITSVRLNKGGKFGRLFISKCSEYVSSRG